MVTQAQVASYFLLSFRSCPIHHRNDDSLFTLRVASSEQHRDEREKLYRYYFLIIFNLKK